MPGNGGSWFTSKGGGGGKPSIEEGELELFLTPAPTDGENIDLFGNDC